MKNIEEIYEDLRRNWRSYAFPLGERDWLGNKTNRRAKKEFKPGPQWVWFEENILSYPILTRAAEFRNSISRMMRGTVPSINVIRRIIHGWHYVEIQREGENWVHLRTLKDDLVIHSTFSDPTAHVSSKVVIYFRDIDLSDEDKEKYLILRADARALGCMRSKFIYILRSEALDKITGFNPKAGLYIK